MHAKDVKIDLGVIETDPAGSVTGYIEKPTLSYGVSMGIYVYSDEALALIRRGEYLDFPSLVLRLLAGKKVAAFPSRATWLDLGRLEDLQRATEIFAVSRHEFLPDSAPRRAAS